MARSSIRLFSGMPFMYWQNSAKNIEAMIALVDRALALNPSYAHGHETRVARHIGGENGGQPAFDAFRGQSGPLQPHGPNGSSALKPHSNGKREGWHSLSERRSIRLRPVGSSMNAGLKISKLGLEILSVSLPCYAIHSGGRVPL
jgi:hypothetical protein